MKPIFGREAGLSELLNRIGSLVFVEGHSGIGKTRLLEAACERARTQEVRVLWASGQELERDFSFGVVRQLFEKLLRSGSEQDRKGKAGQRPDRFLGLPADHRRHHLALQDPGPGSTIFGRSTALCQQDNLQALARLRLRPTCEGGLDPSWSEPGVAGVRPVAIPHHLIGVMADHLEKLVTPEPIAFVFLGDQTLKST
jgi:hypothetical protein